MCPLPSSRAEYKAGYSLFLADKEAEAKRARLFAQSHTASRGPRWDSIPDLSDSEVSSLYIISIPYPPSPGRSLRPDAIPTPSHEMRIILAVMPRFLDGSMDALGLGLWRSPLPH